MKPKAISFEFPEKRENKPLVLSDKFECDRTVQIITSMAELEKSPHFKDAASAMPDGFTFEKNLLIIYKIY